MADKNIFETIKETAEKVIGPSNNQKSGELILDITKDVEKAVTDAFGPNHGGTIRPVPEGTIFQPRYSGGGKTYSGQDYNEAMKSFNQAMIDNSVIADALTHRATYPEFTVKNGKVTLSGESKYMNSDVVKAAAKTLQDYYKGYDLTNKQVAESFQKSLDGVNQQIKSNLQYQEYNDFLSKSNFSDTAYRNYALAKQESDPKTTTNVTKSTKKITTYDKNGKLQTWTPEQWINYWKENYSPEERIQLWIDSSEALGRASSDDDLYRGIPFLIMGQQETENVPARIMAHLNPFDSGGVDWDKDARSAVVNVPIYGFDDVSQWDAFWDALWSTNREAFYRLVSNIGGMTDPLQRAIGQKYVGQDVSTPEKWGNTVGIEGVTYDTIGNISREEWNKLADLVNEYFFSRNKRGNSTDILIEDLGKDDAAKLLLVRDFSTINKRGRDAGWDAYQNFKDMYALQQTEGYRSPYEKWGKEREDEMQKHLERLGTLAPSSTTFGVVAGTIGRIMAEQAALGLVSGGALTASNIAQTLTRGGWKLASGALNTIGVGQTVLSKSPAVAKAVAALAAGSAEGLAGAAKTIYTIGSIGTWAIREMGEDVVRGLVDDVVTTNSLDSQGNLDPNRLAENIYMNALMYGAAKGLGGIWKGLGAVVDNAKTRNIDGAELNSTQLRQLQLFRDAMDDSNSRTLFRGVTDDGHPIISVRGRKIVLDQLTPSAKNLDAIEETTSTVSPTASRTIESVLENEDIPADARQKISDIVESERIPDDPEGRMRDGWEEDIRSKIKEQFSDDEIRQMFPDGVVKIGDDTIRVDTKEFLAGDINRVGGQSLKTADDAIDALKVAKNVSDFADAVNGLYLRGADFARDWKQAVQSFAARHNITPEQVQAAIRESRIAGREVLPGLRELWVEHWKPMQDKLLDLQEQYTGVRPTEHEFYARDMIKGTFQLGENGTWTINDGAATDLLGGDSTFDLTASSFVHNTGKLAEQLTDKLENDPEILAREFIVSRVQTIYEHSDMGKIFTAMREANEAGEFEFSEADARKAVGVTEQVAKEVSNSAGVQKVQELTNVAPLSESFGKAEADPEIQRIDTDIEEMQKEIARTQEEINSLKPQTDAHSIVPKLDYETRQRLAERFVRNNDDYILAYRNQNTGIDDWYSNGTGGRGGDPTVFDSYGSDKGDLTDAVWLTTDKEWAESAEKSSAGTGNGAPDQTIVIPIKKSLIVDAGGERPSFDPNLGEADMGDSWGPYYSLRRFSELNDNKIVQTRGAQLDEKWTAARDRLGYVSDAMRDRLNPSFYNRTELVLFRDTQPDILRDGERAILEEYNAENELLNRRAIRNREQELRTQQKILTDLENERVKAVNEYNARVADAGPAEMTTKEVSDAVKLNKKQVVDAQKTFNAAADKSTSAEQLSRSSGYKNRSIKVESAPVVGVNYMPGNPFHWTASWINDHFVKANAIRMAIKNGTGDTVSYVTAYDGGYKMYAEAGTFARNVVVEIQNGSSLHDAIYKQIRDNGFFIEPSDYQKMRYGALGADQQAAKITDKIMDRMTRGNYYYKWSDAFNDDGSVKSTDAMISILTTRFRGQGINDFMKFVKKADWDTLDKGQQKWLNKRMYEMTASINKKSIENIAGQLAKFSMGLRYRSNMWFNFKNGQLQLTECQRLFTLNKLGDFKDTIKRLTSDSDYRQKVSDYTYSLAPQSIGRGLTKADLDGSVDATIKLADASNITKDGIYTNIDTVKAKFRDFNDDALSAIEGGEYAKNYILIAGFVAAGEKQGLSGAELDTYVRNRFNTEALAGTDVGRIGLTDSRIGQFTFMYLGFPLRELNLQWHMLRGGGLRGDMVGSLEYLAKMLGTKGLVWAMEAPWGYSFMDVMGGDPFGISEQYDQISTPYEDREPGWRALDFAVRYSPFTQGAMTSAFADIYFAYRAAEEKAREDYKEEHNGSTEGFEWSMADAGGGMWEDLVKGLTPGYTAYSRVTGELGDLDRGYHISQAGNRLYETNTDLPNVLWGMITGRKNTANAQDYYQTANPIRGLVEGGLPGLGQQIGRANPFRGFREFDPIDPDTFQDWFDGSYQDQQNWNTGIYSFREEAQAIADKYNKYANAGTAVNDMASRENELADLRNRVEAYVNAYTSVHPEGISGSKQNQLISIFSLNDNTTLDQAFNQSQGQYDNTAWDMAENRYSQGNFPTAYGLNQNKEGETSYVQSPQLEQALSQHRYGINAEAAPLIKRLYNNQKFSTPDGNLTMKEYHDKVYSRLQNEWNKSKPDYKKITKIQEEYLKYVEQNVIKPTLETYGSGVLSAGKTSDIMQEFGKMLNGMIPSNDYRVDKYGKQIYRSTPYMTVDIPAWLKKNYGSYKNATNTTDKKSGDRIKEIRSNVNKGRRSVAKAQAQALIDDLPTGKASLSRDELEWLQGVLND